MSWVYSVSENFASLSSIYINPGEESYCNNTFIICLGFKLKFEQNINQKTGDTQLFIRSTEEVTQFTLKVRFRYL